MKYLKTIFTIIAISIATTFSTTATEKKATTVIKELRTELVSLLDKEIPFELKKSSKAEVSFIINDKNEIVVVNVDTNLNEFTSYVKRKLNYKKLSTIGVKTGEIYKMPIKINKK